jgi:hypothetical protein
MQKELKGMIKEISQEEGVPEEIVKAVIDAQFHLTRKLLSEGDYNDESSFLNVRYMHLGIFVAKPIRIRRINKRRLENERKKQL